MFAIVAALALAYGLLLVVLARLTARVILRPPRWGLAERWPGVPFLGRGRSPADLPPWLCQMPHGLLVVDASPAEAAAQLASSLKPGDLIRSIDAIPSAPAEAERLATWLRSRSAGDRVHLVVERQGVGLIDCDLSLPKALTSPSDLHLPFEAFSARSAGGQCVRGWYIPPPDRGRRAPALVFLHGRQTNRRHVGLTDLAGRAHDRGYAVVLLDLFGSGESDGDVDFWGTEEARVAVDFLRGRSGVDPDRIGFVGVSFGGMKAMLAGTDPRTCAGAVVILSLADTTPNHIRLTVPPCELPLFMRRRLLRGMTLPRWLVESGRPLVHFWIRRETGRCLSEIRPKRVAAKVRCPVFVAHGTADRTFPPECAHRIFETIPTPKVFHSVQGHDHFTTAQSGEPLWRQVFAFLDEYLVSPVTPRRSEPAAPDGDASGPSDAARFAHVATLPAAD